MTFEELPVGVLAYVSETDAENSNEMGKLVIKIIVDDEHTVMDIHHGLAGHWTECNTPHAWKILEVTPLLEIPRNFTELEALYNESIQN